MIKLGVESILVDVCFVNIAASQSSWKCNERMLQSWPCVWWAIWNTYNLSCSNVPFTPNYYRQLLSLAFYAQFPHVVHGSNNNCQNERSTLFAYPFRMNKIPFHIVSGPKKKDKEKSRQKSVIVVVVLVATHEVVTKQKANATKASSVQFNWYNSIQ